MYVLLSAMAVVLASSERQWRRQSCPPAAIVTLARGPRHPHRRPLWERRRSSSMSSGVDPAAASSAAATARVGSGDGRWWRPFPFACFSSAGAGWLRSQQAVVEAHRNLMDVHNWLSANESYYSR